MDTIASVTHPVAATILDPWYNKGRGGTIPNYINWLGDVVEASAGISSHIFVWGFPEIVCGMVDRIPTGFQLTAWLTWYYKNCPSVIRGWRSSQNACLHISREDAALYPEHFLNDAQKEKRRNGKLRFMPGPPSVLEVPLLVGFIGKDEQTGHPAQKPEKVYEPLVLMSTKPGDWVLDPMSGAGTTGAVCVKYGRHAILADNSEDYTQIAEQRLEIPRTGFER
jgi:site-specific DNA-methyltransferase (adenine-specific)